jgi:heat shock protein HslJ
VPRSTLMLAIMAAPLIFNGAVFADDHPLKGTRWALKKVQGVAVHTGLTLSFEDTRVTGSTGCNRFWAPVDYLPASAIDIGPPQSARLYCQGAMAVERAYLASLETVVTFRIDGSILQMSLDDGDIFLELERDQTSSP